jgi:hypothetical protein
MRLLLYSDLQAGEGSERCFHDPTLPLQRYRVKMFFRVIREIFEEMGCNALFDLGDTVDDRTAIPHPTIDVLFEGLSYFEATRSSNLRINGNHDQYLKSGKINVGKMFRGIFTVVDEPVVMEISGVKTLLVPYPDENFDIEGWLDANLTTGGELLLGHFHIDGAVDRDGNKLKGGISLRTVARAKLAVLGDIHHPQSLAKNVHYVGSPFQQEFSESGEKKRVAVLDMPNLNLAWVEMTGFPTYAELSLPEWEQRVEEEGDSENRYRVLINGTAEAERYFQHPRMRQAKPVYLGIAAQVASHVNAPRVGKLSFQAADVLRRYVHSRPPTQLFGLTEDEFVQVGLDILDTSCSNRD